MDDSVVLVNEKNEPLGEAKKLDVHHDNTPLHRGFSLFLFNHKGNLLLQQRSHRKKTWPGVWSNSVCGHPKLHESPTTAAKRRLAFELGIYDSVVYEIIPDYRYKVEKNGISENEICPVLVGFTDKDPKINEDEVAAIRWVSWNAFLDEIHINPSYYSPWAVEEALLLSKNRKFLTVYHLKK